jgi:Cyclin, N-terminal domain/Cyclin, C-terminal domain
VKQEVESVLIAPRRSGRLSTAPDAATETTVGGSIFHDINARTTTVPAGKRGRTKSVGREVSTRRAKVPRTKRLRSFEDAKLPPPRESVIEKASAGARRGLFETDRFKMEGLPQEHHNLVLANFDPTRYTSGLSVFDVANQGDILQSPDYVSDIFQRLYHSEVRQQTLRYVATSRLLSRSLTSRVVVTHQTLNTPNRYIHNQKEISETMRAVLVDWLVEIHLKFRCEPETLHLAVNILDRYLTSVDVPRDMLQLVGGTALLLAAKYEEIYPPELHDIVVITNRTYTKQDVLDMEAEILSEISFNLTVSTGYPFLQRFLFVTQATKTMGDAAKYYMERMLQEHDSLMFRPSVIAAAAVCLAINHPEIRDYDEIESEKPGVVSRCNEQLVRCASSLSLRPNVLTFRISPAILWSTVVILQRQYSKQPNL